MWKNEPPHTLHSKISYSDSYTSLKKTLTCILWVNFLACELYLKKAGIKINKAGIKKSTVSVDLGKYSQMFDFSLLKMVKCKNLLWQLWHSKPFHMLVPG